MADQQLNWDSVEAEEIPVDKLQDNSYVQQLLQSAKIMSNLEEEVTLPYTVTDITLMSPGVWKDYKYTGQAIKNAYNRTDWDDSEVKSLFWDHEDRASEKWIGEVKNVRLEGNRIVGDLEIVDKEAAIKLAYGAKFGISPKVTGDVHGQNMKSFVFDNFSVVLNPAVKTAYINNMEVKTVSEQDNSEELEEEETQEEEDVEEDQETEENKNKDIKEVAGELADLLDVEVAEVMEVIDSLLNGENGDYPKPYKNAEDILNQLKELAEEEDEEVDESEEVDNEETDEYAEFVKDYRKKNPNADLKEIAEMWEEKQKSADEKISEATSGLEKKIENLEKQVNEKSNKIEELEEKVKKPQKLSRRSDDEDDKSLKDKVEELDDSELDKKMLEHMERLQGTKTGGALK